MPIDYLGNKASLLDFVTSPMLDLEDVETVIDPFCGTAVVSSALAQAGKSVVAGDMLRLCTTLAEATLLPADEPSFLGIASEVPRRPGLSMHESVIAHLNDIPGQRGFIYRTYSPASESTSGIGRMYLTEHNAAKVDAIRHRIAQMSAFLSRPEEALLLSSLATAVSRVSNTAGTYGCFLKRWKARARDPLCLVPFRAPRPGLGAHRVILGNAEDIVRTTPADLIYLDPPYTKRQYAAYYHLLDTIVAGAEPDVTGLTGLPRWQDRSSDFCYRARAGKALRRLLSGAQARHVLLSYSEDGQMAHSEILAILSDFGTVHVSEMPSKRYRSNYSLPHRGPVVHERLYHLAMGA